jgi:hypothetical protein
MHQRMGSYGRSFEWRATPVEQARYARARVVGPVPIGAPVTLGPPLQADFTDALSARLTTGEQEFLVGSGVVVYEWIDYHRLDPQIATLSDRDTVPDGVLCQVISDTSTKLIFKNYGPVFAGRSRFNRIMVAGVGGATNLAVGDYLTPGSGNDTFGYWTPTVDVAHAWLTVTRVDLARGEVEAVGTSPVAEEPAPRAGLYPAVDLYPAVTLYPEAG